MNNDIENKIKEIKKLLIENQVIKEFLVITNDEVIKDKLNYLVNEVKFYKSCNKDDENNKIASTKYYELVNNPFVNNYLNLKEEYEILIEEIKEIIRK